MRNVFILIYEYYYDSQIIDETLLNKEEMFPLTVREGFKTKIKFVGAIINENKIIFSFPKKYLTDDEFKILRNNPTSDELYSKYSRDLIKFLKKHYMNNFDGLYTGNDLRSSFPVNDYMNILNYYSNYGIYTCECTHGESGRVDWLKTIRYNNGFFSGNNLIFNKIRRTPGKRREHDLISYLMEYSLQIGYENFGKFLEIGFNYKSLKKINNPQKFIDYVKSKIMITNVSKDVSLMKSILNILNWINNNSGNTFFCIKDFSLCWERLVDFFLNYRYKKINDMYNIETYDKLNFKKVRQYFSKDNDRFYGEYDHLSVSDEYVYLFDSKYYNVVDSLNYKQLSYNFLIFGADLKNTMGKISKNDIREKVILNALILPTDKIDHIKKNNHIDLSYIYDSDYTELFKNVKISEIYLNIKKIVHFYVE